jgi:hypothetical protein
MAQHFKPDPYDGFKSDSERRRALNTRMVCYTIVGVSASLSPFASNLKEILPWLKILFT